MIICSSCKAENEQGSSFCAKCGARLDGKSSSNDYTHLNTPDPNSVTVDPTPPVDEFDLELESGSLFAGRYTIVEKVGQGGMGVVYHATENLAGRERKIALKLVRTDRLVNKKAIDRLINEGALTQDIQHPNVVNVYNVGEVDGHPFVAMEFLDGHSLREWHRRKMNAGQDVSAAQTAKIINSILDGLEAAHNMGVIHRDLKPENIMLTSEPGPDGVDLKIVDFGIARAPGPIETGTGTGLGSYRYMAPEQVTNPDAVRASGDLYSLSLVFYELLMDAVPHGVWQPPSSGRSDVPARIDALLQQGVSVKPSSRPQSVAEFRALMKGETPPRPEPKPGPTPSPSPVPPVPGPTPNIGKVALLGCGGLIGLFFLIVLLQMIFGGGGSDWEDTDTSRLSSSGGTTSGGDEPPPPPEVNYSGLSGTWYFSPTIYQDIQVSEDGSFSIATIFENGTTGVINGSIADAKFASNPNPDAEFGDVKWDGGCHITLDYRNNNNVIWRSEQFHVDHLPGASCPARFNQQAN